MPAVIFPGPEGRLEGRYHHAKRPNAPVALLLHPHPLHGGTMNNRVIHSLYVRYQAMGFSVLVETLNLVTAARRKRLLVSRQPVGAHDAKQP